MDAASMTCETCGAPATHTVRDIQEGPPDGLARTFFPCKGAHTWCDEHVRESRTYPYPGHRAGAGD